MFNKKTKKYISAACAVILTLAMLSGCSKSKKSEEVQRPEKPENLPIATIVVKGYGTMEAELYPHIAPNTVNNFISLANKGFYNGLTFHRIIKGFMIQGGDPKGTGEGGPGYSIKGEFKSNGFENNLKHELGVLSMARTKIPDSAGSQFFIMTGTSSNLDGEYAAFGKIISGIDILEKVGVVKTSSNDRPVDEVIIESITVDTKGTDYKEPVTIK